MCPIELFSGQGPSPEDEAWVQTFHDVVMDSVRVFAELEAAQNDEPEAAHLDSGGQAPGVEDEGAASST